ncbi:hypothetical protein RD792_001491, partial [Penstemon davidsonii]
GKYSVSVDDTLKIITCREQQKKLAALNVDLEKARQEGFESKHLTENSETTKKKLLAVIGIVTMFGRKNNRDAIRKAWMPAGASKVLLIQNLNNAGVALKKLEEEKGMSAMFNYFAHQCSVNRGDSSDREIDSENGQANDFIILVSLCMFDVEETDKICKSFSCQNDHVESPEERAKKTKLFLIHAVEHWDAEFYVKISDDVYVKIDALGAVLASQLDKPRVYIGCMKSGEVFSQPKHKWYEPDWWKFGDGKSPLAANKLFLKTDTFSMHLVKYLLYHKHWLSLFLSTGLFLWFHYTILLIISQHIQSCNEMITLGAFCFRFCRLVLRTYAHDDVSVGSWFIGLDVQHIDEGKFCCSSWSSGAIILSSLFLYPL